jgi:DNA mismatch repair protein MutL
MGRVRVLDESLVSLISAGEVIESPASIVKELIENSLDAGAESIAISIEHGGIDRISVTDNGSGILNDDLPVCILRYSTSKVSNRDDLDEIRTYGFRGEALASIAAVADLVIESKSSEEDTGSKLTLFLGGDPAIQEISRSQGTKIEVSNLFAKIPARRKHLASGQVEAQRVHEIIIRHALVRFEIGFTFHRDDQEVINCPPGQTLEERVLSLMGSDIARAMVQVDHEDEDIKVSGFVVRPPLSRGNRGREYLSILKRPVVEQRLSMAVENAYDTLLMRGRYPIFCLDISLSLQDVDANVHPTKREVRVLDIERVAEVLSNAVQLCLSFDESIETTLPLESFLDVDELEPEIALHEQLSLDFDSTETETELDMPTLGGTYKIIGQFSKLYILLDFEDDLVLVDQHAAHERILYERLRKQVNDESVVVQDLLEPVVLSLDPVDLDRMLSVTEDLSYLGFSIEPFGGKEILVSSVPEILGTRATTDEMIVFVDRILSEGTKHPTKQFLDEAVKVTACHSAIRAGQSLNTTEIQKLLSELARTDSRYHCCHGRPSILRISRKELDTKFGRTGADAIARYRARHSLDSDS